MGPVPKWGLYFYWGRGITRVVITAPFIRRLTLMPVTQSSGNSYLFLERASRVMASLLRKFLFLVRHMVRTCQCHGIKLEAPTEPDVIADMAKVPYRKGVGKALYASVATRGDIGFYVQALTRLVNNPSPAHLRGSILRIRARAFFLD